MKAIVKSKAEEGLWLEAVLERWFGVNDVVIRMVKIGICVMNVSILLPEN